MVTGGLINFKNKKMNRKENDNATLKVGVTGEMGAGKSFICNLFAEKGVPIYNCDKNAKLLVLSNDNLKNDIKKHFGEDIYEGNVFKNLSAIVFDTDKQSVANLKILSDLIHPYIYADIDEFCEKNKKSIYCLIESAILFENKMETELDLVIYVSVDLDIRMKRAIDRDKITEEEYKNRMKTQINPEVKKTKANYLIYNDGKHSVADRVSTIHSSIQNSWIYSGTESF